MNAIPPMIKWLLIFNGIGFLAQMNAWALMLKWFALWPIGSPDQVMTSAGVMDLPGFQPWQLLSYGFLHGNLTHLFFNMFGLWMFGRAVEAVWGGYRFLVFYLVCVVGAGIIQLATLMLTAEAGEIYPTLGASGGLFGVLLAFGMMFPNARVMLLFPPIPMTAKWLVIGYGAIELFFGVTGTAAGIAHFAHLGGMLFGFALIMLAPRHFPLRPGIPPGL